MDLESLYVDGAYDGATPNGSKSEPYRRIGEAINKAKEIGATVVKVAKGNYTESIIIDENISLFGGYNEEIKRAATVMLVGIEIFELVKSILVIFHLSIQDLIF